MSGSFDPRISAYFGDAVLQAGFMPLPHLFLRYYRRLGLSHIQAMFTLQLMEIAWDISSPPTSVSKLAARMGVGHRTIQVCSKELHALGLVEIYDQFDTEGAQVENGYDLSPLFRRLAEFAPATHPAGEIRARRIRPRDAEDTSAHPQVSGAVTDTPPVQESAPAPRKNLHRPPESSNIPPVLADSGLKEEHKNLPKKQTRNKEHAAVVSTENKRIGEQIAYVAEGMGHSLRWDISLSQDEISRSRRVLEQIGLNALVVDPAAVSLHPAECWGLWAYARDAGLGTPWIASQLFDFGARRVRPTTQAQAYDAAGKLLDALPFHSAERILNAIDNEAQYLPLGRHNDGIAVGGEQEAFEAVQAARTAQRGKKDRKGTRGNSVDRLPGTSVSQLQLVDEPVSTTEPCWEAVCGRLHNSIPAEEFETWIAPLRMIRVEDALMVLVAPNLFVRNEISERFVSSIAAALEAELDHHCRIELVIDQLVAV